MTTAYSLRLCARQAPIVLSQPLNNPERNCAGSKASPARILLISWDLIKSYYHAPDRILKCYLFFKLLHFNTKLLIYSFYFFFQSKQSCLLYIFFFSFCGWFLSFCLGFLRINQFLSFISYYHNLIINLYSSKMIDWISNFLKYLSASSAYFFSFL